MDALKFFLFSHLGLTLSGCYTLKSAYNQVSILVNRQSYESLLEKPSLSEDQKRKLHLAQSVRDFALTELGLSSNGNYQQVTWLDRPYVVWAVSASDPWALKSHQWSFPIVGKVPYLGFFNLQEAQEKEKELSAEGYDTYVRGVSAYSTLGWFADPLLSSMLNYKDEVLAETLIHELVHTTLWIPDNVNFNERLASYLGQKGAELYFLKTEGPESASYQRMKNATHDDQLFSSFITEELRELDLWYKKINSDVRDPAEKSKRIREIQDRFSQQVKPKMKGPDWDQFDQVKLNNARLLLYRTYLSDFTSFDRLWQSVNGDFKAFLQKCQTLKKSGKPEQDLELLSKL
jgi:predicted aminopeptidase